MSSIMLSTIMWIIGKMVSLTNNKLLVKSYYVNFISWRFGVKIFWSMYLFKTRRTCGDMFICFNEVCQWNIIWWTLQKNYKHYEHIESVTLYKAKGWANKGVPWKKLWSTFGRLFTYGDANTSNYVECFLVTL